ncbi:hypothetical protein FVEN_g5597 [Fusarium venenatum]|nr:hypothetical protein FVEN_g5597 [Fusarium venenatum]
MAKQRRDMKKPAGHYTAVIDRLTTAVMQLSLSVAEPLRRPNAENEVLRRDMEQIQHELKAYKERMNKLEARQGKSDDIDSSNEPIE